VKVRKYGFPMRIYFNEFYLKYHELDHINRRIRIEKHKASKTDMRALIKEILIRIMPNHDKKGI
jgi:hypothetical protein